MLGLLFKAWLGLELVLLVLASNMQQSHELNIVAEEILHEGGPTQQQS